ncbi:MAG: glucose-6-phosphate isomerase [Rhodospirillaceae bacterium]|jgi:glucose-6-phosphate isomerase|nr:glucose-6-phosphate isomerase [Rhodospirillaceae bacterium]
MSYVHLTSTCFAEALGSHGLDRSCYEQILAKTEDALTGLRTRHKDGSLPLLRLPEARDDLAMLKPVADAYRTQFDNVVLLGTGGSSLGGQTICRLADCGFGPREGTPKIHFFDNVDPHSIQALLHSVALDRTGFLVVSKSGSTAETLTQFFICFKAARDALGDKAAGNFTVITEPGDNVLRRLATEHGIATLDHDPGVGGRYSALSLVGLLPAMIAGLDPVAIREGAAGVLAPVLDGAPPESVEPAIGAALSVGLATENRISTTVVMPYIDRLADFGLWFRQLWAESLGKNGKGTTPVNALGTTDQHSQLQLYLDGPRDKMFTVMMLGCAGDGPAVDPSLARDESLAYLAGKTIGDLMDAEQRATAQTLVSNNRPTRLFQLETLDEKMMGALMMHFMLETIIAAHLLNVDPFDQPAVEEGKILTRQYLAEEDR